MLSRPNNLSVHWNQIVPETLSALNEQNQSHSRSPGRIPRLSAGLLSAGLVTLVLLPFTSALPGALTNDLSPFLDVWLVFFTALVVFSAAAAIILRGSNWRAVIGRGLACLSTALIVSPVGLSVLFALYLQDWVSLADGMVIEQVGSTAATLVGGIFFANAVALGLALGCVILLVRWRLLQARPKPSISPYAIQTAVQFREGPTIGASWEQLK